MKDYFAKAQNVTYKGLPATYYPHSMGRKTLIQSLVLGLVLGPILFAFQDHTIANLLWCMAGMALAPFVVDMLKPTIILK